MIERLLTSTASSGSESDSTRATCLRYEFLRTGKGGYPRHSILKAAKNLLYAQVVKRRGKSRVVEITSRVVFDRKKAVAAQLN
jgi:hypothetical protein